MRKKYVQFLIASGVAFSLAFSLVPSFSDADQDLPNEAFALNVAADDPFPYQVELASRVNFWTHVFGVWGRRQIALHDMNNPGVVYEVLTLPDSHSGGGVNRNDFIREHVEDLVHRLHILEQKVAVGEDLDSNEQALLDRFRAVGAIPDLAGAHERVRIQSGVREKFLEGLKISGRYDALFRTVFHAHGVPEDLAYLPHIESSFQAGARSGAGAVGIWQFTLPAAKTFLMNVNAAVDERYDPVLAAEGCARYLAHAYEQLGDWGLAITSYNHGIGGMSNAKSKVGTNFPKILNEYEGALFGFDSRNYYVEFLAAREVARNADRYFGPVHREQPLRWEKVALDHAASLYTIARNYGVTLDTLTEINASLTTRAVKGRVALPEGTSVWLPQGTTQRLAARTSDEDTVSETPIKVVRAPRSQADSMVASIAEGVPMPINTHAASENNVHNKPNAAAKDAESDEDNVHNRPNAAAKDTANNEDNVHSKAKAPAKDTANNEDNVHNKPKAPAKDVASTENNVHSRGKSHAKDVEDAESKHKPKALEGKATPTRAPVNLTQGKGKGVVAKDSTAAKGAKPLNVASVQRDSKAVVAKPPVPPTSKTAHRDPPQTVAVKDKGHVLNKTTTKPTHKKPTSKQLVAFSGGRNG